jgi:hypothetical protein
VADPRVVALALAAAATSCEAIADDPPARRLPRVTTVCRAAAERRCWTEPGESRCPRGEVFRIVIDEPGRSDVATALAECRRPPDAK